MNMRVGFQYDKKFHTCGKQNRSDNLQWVAADAGVSRPMSHHGENDPDEQEAHGERHQDDHPRPEARRGSALDQSAGRG